MFKILPASVEVLACRNKEAVRFLHFANHSQTCQSSCLKSYHTTLYSCVSLSLSISMFLLSRRYTTKEGSRLSGGRHIETYSHSHKCCKKWVACCKCILYALCIFNPSLCISILTRLLYLLMLIFAGIPGSQHRRQKLNAVSTPA